MLLALDSSTRIVGLALYNGSQVISESIWTSHDHHTVELAPALADILSRSGVKASDLQGIAVAIGPGSFTGLRIGLALAKGLALVRRLALIGVPTLDILAASQPVQPVPMAAVLRAGRGRLAVGWYHAGDENWQSDKQIEVLTASELNQRIQFPTLVVGELDEEERRILARKRKNIILPSPAQSQRRPSFLAEIGWQRLQTGETDNPATLAPIYLHYKESIPG